MCLSAVSCIGVWDLWLNINYIGIYIIAKKKGELLMRYHRHMRNWMTVISIAFFLITVIFSYLQVTNIDKTVYAILNNLSICILTGCLIALLQFGIGYHNAKYSDLLSYYKDLILLEEKIAFYPFQHSGFVDSVSGLKEIREILNFYSSSVQSSYRQIDFDGRCDQALNAAKELHVLYRNQMKPFFDFRDALCDGVSFMRKSDEDLLREGITDISEATEKMNSMLQSKENAVAELYNDKKEHEKRNAAYKILEEYLFGKKEAMQQKKL